MDERHAWERGPSGGQASARSRRVPSARLTAVATGQRKRRRRTATFDHDAELWAHIEPASSRLLLLSALDAFLARGFHAATTREIAERAGMSPAAVYVHWRGEDQPRLPPPPARPPAAAR